MAVVTSVWVPSASSSLGLSAPTAVPSALTVAMSLPSALIVTELPAVMVPLVVTEASLRLMFTPQARAPVYWLVALLSLFLAWLAMVLPLEKEALKRMPSAVTPAGTL